MSVCDSRVQIRYSLKDPFTIARGADEIAAQVSSRELLHS